ncbi:MAG: hypothetical protein MZV65_19245 [Chromatiales bacterium]|nr:hypothetical protein [Chromatiales bacterium]
MHGLFVACHARAARRQHDDLVLPKFDPRPVVARAAAGDRVHGRADATTRACSPSRRSTRDACRAHAAVRLRLGAAADRDLRRVPAQRTGHTILERYGMTRDR